MYQSHSVLLYFLKYKAGFIKQVWSRPHPLFSHHHPCLQGFQVFNGNLPRIRRFSSPEHTNRFTCFQVQADFVVPNLICWARLQHLVSQYHSLRISVMMLCSYTRIREIKVWLPCVEEGSLRRLKSLPSPFPFRLAKYLFPVFLETVQQRLALWNSVEWS